MASSGRGFLTNGAVRLKRKSARRDRKSRPSKLPKSLSVQSRENFRIAYVGPSAGQFEGFYFFPGLRELADRIRQLELAARRRFQLRSEIENARSKRVEPGVIPGTCRFARLRFFPKIDKLHLLVYEDGAAFAHVFAARHADHCFDA